MKQPRQAERRRRGENAPQPRRVSDRRSLPDRFRPFARWAFGPLLIVAAFVAGLPGGGWRPPLEAVLALDPSSLLPFPGLGLEPWTSAIVRWALSALFGAAAGALVWARKGPSAGGGLFAACTAGGLMAGIEAVRLFKPGQLPDLFDPVAAAAAAAGAWRLLRLLPVQPVTPLPRFSPGEMRRRILVRFLAGGVAAAGVGAAVLGISVIAETGLTPSRIEATIAALPEGRTGASGIAATTIAGTLKWSGAGYWLRSANALAHPDDLSYPLWVGDRRDAGDLPATARPRVVATIDQVRWAIEDAMPGDVIILRPGTYRIKGGHIDVVRPGTSAAPIMVRAMQPGSVILESEMDEAIRVTAPHWRFENLYLRGVCASDSACDNGFHIAGAAEDTLIRNMRIEDFNAHIKINGENGKFPDRGTIVHTSMVNTHVRNTDASVTPIDLVAASLWTIEENLIADFLKSGGNKVSFGAFAKGEGRGNVFRRNVVLCEWHLHAAGVESIGLSFGGGGTGQLFRREQGLTGFEHADGIIDDNLIAFCSDDGIYLNRAANTLVKHNTLIATSGIDVRYPESTARIEGNMVDGPIRQRDGGLLKNDSNVSGSLSGMFLGLNPVRGLFVDPARLDLRWTSAPEEVPAGHGYDVCGRPWPLMAAAGAIVDFRGCLSPRR